MSPSNNSPNISPQTSPLNRANSTSYIGRNKQSIYYNTSGITGGSSYDNPHLRPEYRSGSAITKSSNNGNGSNHTNGDYTYYNSNSSSIATHNNGDYTHYDSARDSAYQKTDNNNYGGSGKDVEMVDEPQYPVYRLVFCFFVQKRLAFMLILELGTT